MIKFTCKNCGQRISVPEIYAGKKGKCPKCKELLFVPKIEITSSTNQEEDPATSKQLHSPPPVTDLRLKKEPSDRIKKHNRVFANGSDVTPHREQIATMDEVEKPPVRKLPWIMDMFLYPTSTSGLINLGIFWILPILLGLIGRILPIPFIWAIASLIVAAYMYYYFMECIRDSAKGSIRAPENIGSMPSMGDAISQAMEIVASVVIFWGPVAAYSMYKSFWQSSGSGFTYDPRTDVLFWLLLAYGIFFFPMGLLALAMFDSTSAFNPLLWIASIFSTFFHYSSLVLFFCVLAWLVSRVISSFPQSWLFAYLFGVAFIYLAMVAAHLLGRFYYLNSKKLNWEV